MTQYMTYHTIYDLEFR